MFNVEFMGQMFMGANSFNQPLNKWDVSKVTSMWRMFEYASSFNQPLNNWDVSNVKYIGGMFTEIDKTLARRGAQAKSDA